MKTFSEFLREVDQSLASYLEEGAKEWMKKADNCDDCEDAEKLCPKCKSEKCKCSKYMKRK